MATQQRVGKVARVRLIPPFDLFGVNDQRVTDAFVAGTAATRYGRTWLMGRVAVSGGYLSGRIGFEADEGQTEVWDAVQKDFLPVGYPMGTTSPFALRLEGLEMAFQTRGTTIRVNTFIGAMQALIRAATSEQEWQIVTSRKQMSVSAWAQSVSRVTRIRFHLDRPNPNYQDRPQVEALLEGANALSGTVQFQNPDGLATDGEIVRQLLDHVGRGYGDATLTGERIVDGETVAASYETRLQGETDVHDRPADDHGDVPLAELEAELGGPPPSTGRED